MKLLARLNYKFSIDDCKLEIKGLYEKNIQFSCIYKIFNNKNIFFLNHARTGLRILLNSLNLPPHAKIGVQIYNCQTVFIAIERAGFVPIFIDVDETLTIDLFDLKRKHNELDALIVSHIFGIPAKFNKIKEIIGDKPIIEDCSHSFLSKIDSKYTGVHGDCAIFSFGKGKFPSIGDGGFVLINNTSLVQNVKKEIQKLVNPSFYGELRNILRNIVLNFLTNQTLYFIINLFKHNNSNSNSKYENSKEKKYYKSNTSLFIIKLKEHKKILEQQKNNGYIIAKSLIRLEGVSIPIQVFEDNVNKFMIPVFTKDKQSLIQQFFINGIEIKTHFSNCIVWAEKYGYKKNDCPNIEIFLNDLVVFPCHYEMNDKSILKIQDVANGLISEKLL